MTNALKAIALVLFTISLISCSSTSNNSISDKKFIEDLTNEQLIIGAENFKQKMLVQGEQLRNIMKKMVPNDVPLTPEICAPLMEFVEIENPGLTNSYMNNLEWFMDYCEELKTRGVDSSSCDLEHENDHRDEIWYILKWKT